MKLTNCILDINRVYMRPLVRTSPHSDWQRAHEDKGQFYSFLPNRFPIFHESQISSSDKSQTEPINVQNYSEENYIHQDIVEYSERLLKKVYIVIDRCFKVLSSTYIGFRSFDLNKSALKSLKDKKTKYDFRYFDK